MTSLRRVTRGCYHLETTPPCSQSPKAPPQHHASPGPHLLVHGRVGYKNDAQGHICGLWRYSRETFARQFDRPLIWIIGKN